jgi:hypothetical protein
MSMSSPSDAVVFAVASLMLGCSSSADDAGEKADAGGSASTATIPTLDPALDRRIEIDQRAYRPGDRLLAHWPGAEVRGIAYSLDKWTGEDWATEYYITAVQRPTHDPSWWSKDEKGHLWADIGVGGLGPDIAIVPDVADPGAYRLCTANASKQSCVMLTVD